MSEDTCARCGKPFEKTSYAVGITGLKAISVTDEFLSMCPKCYLKWMIEFDIEVI
jgi:DNA-directed RNA polymerase subunit RPC12/RpoP